jgi:hypothetical protein
LRAAATLDLVDLAQSPVDLVNFVLLLRDCSHDRRPALLNGETLSRQVPQCLGAGPRRFRRRPHDREPPHL